MTKQTATLSTTQDIPLHLLHDAPWNETRPIDDPYVQSFREKGQLVTAMVRPHPMQEGEFEIVYGHRRRAALAEAGIDTMRCEVRDLSSEEAEELGAIENAQRLGLTWQQQCRLITGYLERALDDDAPARIASALGLSTAQVKRRARMLSALSESWTNTLTDGNFSAWTVDHFEVVSAFDPRFQEGLYKRLQGRAPFMTVADLKEEIAGESQALKNAPWDLDDVALTPRAGACVGCTKRSDAQSDLFGDAKGASCLDGACFASKLKAFGKRKEAQLLEKHPEAVKVSEDYTSGGKDALRPSAYTEAKKGDKGAVPAIVHGGNGKVALAYVKVKKAAKEPTEKDLAKEEARKKELQITALAIEKLIAVIRDPDTEFHKDAFVVLVQFCLVYGVGLEIEGDDQPKRVRDYAKKKATVPELWAVAVPELERILNRAKWGLENGRRDGDDNADVALAAWLVDVEFSDLLKEAKDEITAQPDMARDADEAVNG